MMSFYCESIDTFYKKEQICDAWSPTIFFLIVVPCTQSYGRIIGYSHRIFFVHSFFSFSFPWPMMIPSDRNEVVCMYVRFLRYLHERVPFFPRFRSLHSLAFVDSFSSLKRISTDILVKKYMFSRKCIVPNILPIFSFFQC